MALEVFNRQELKFVISIAQYESILHAIEPFMRLDNHNKGGRTYRLHNIYIDTADHALIRNSLSKPVYKEKLRLRSYTEFSANNPVFLEIKKRYKKITNKRRTQLPFNEALAFINSGKHPDIHDYTNAQIISEFEVILSRADYEPKTYISYDRIAFQSKDPATDLRITFDTNLTAQRYGQALTRRLLAEEHVIMELKSIHNIPLWLVAVLSNGGIHKQSFSKYGSEYLNYLNTINLKGVTHA